MASMAGIQSDGEPGAGRHDEGDQMRCTSRNNNNILMEALEKGEIG